MPVKQPFLKNFLNEFEGKKLFVIINEFGKEGTDALSFSGRAAALRQVVNGSVFCACKLHEFEAALEEAVKEAPDCIFVESSGLSDPTGIKGILSGPRFDAIEYMGCVCIADAQNLHKVIGTARMVKKQLNVADIVLLNKTDLVSKEADDEVKRMIWEVRPTVEIYETSFGKIEPAWLSTLKKPYILKESYSAHTKDVSLADFLVSVDPSMSLSELTSFLKMFAEDSYRIKGNVTLLNGYYHVDCVGADLSVSPTDEQPSNNLVVLGGHGLPIKTSLEKAISWYHDKVGLR